MIDHEQMVADCEERMDRRRENATNRAQLIQIVATTMGGYFRSQEEERNRKRGRGRNEQDIVAKHVLVWQQLRQTVMNHHHILAISNKSIYN